MSSASTWWVATTGSDANPGTQAAPFATIAHAANGASAGDNVVVENGTYQETPVINASGSSGHPITIQAQNKWGAVLAPISAQIINNSGILVDINGSYITFENFQVKSVDNLGIASTSGVDCQSGSSNCSIIGNQIHDVGYDNTTCPSGAGILVNESNVLLSANVIERVGPHVDSSFRCNAMQGIYIAGGNNGTIQDNLIVYCPHCGALQFFGALSGPSNFTVTNNTFAGVGGAQGDGEAMSIQCSAGTCDNNKFNNNIFANDGGYCWQEFVGSGTFGSHNLYYNNLVFNCPSITWVNGNDNYLNTVTSDPLFVNNTGRVTGNYRLQSRSPARHTGTSNGAPSTDIDGNAIPETDNGYDMGAYQYVNTGN